MKEIPVKNKIEQNGHEVLIKVSPFKKGLKKTEAHRHKGYLEIIFLQGGKGIHHIDGKGYPLGAAQFFIIQKGQLHHWDISEAPDGYVMMLDEHFMADAVDTELRNIIFKIRSKTRISIHHTPTFFSLFSLLCDELSGPNRSKTVVYCLAKALFAKLAWQMESWAASPTSLAHRFLHLLEGPPSAQKNVAHYAARLQTSPQNLSAACKKHLGLAPNIVLAKNLIAEADRLLLYTDNTVNEIAFALGFKDPSYFIKFIRRHLYLTPQQYRQGHFQNSHN